MPKKRKSIATSLDEVDRTLYASFCTAANSLSQLYTHSMNHQKLSFNAGERHALVINLPPLFPLVFDSRFALCKKRDFFFCRKSGIWIWFFLFGIFVCLVFGNLDWWLALWWYWLNVRLIRKHCVFFWCFLFSWNVFSFVEVCLCLILY